MVISDKHEEFALAAGMLRDKGFRVHFQNNIDDTFKALGFDSPNLIISELALPQMDGLQLCRLVRDDENIATTPVLLVGDLARSSSIVESSFRCGAAGYLQKPIDPLDLTTLCSGVLETGTVTEIGDCSDDLLKSLFENISDLITILDVDSTILFESSSIERLLGYSHGELLGVRALDLVHPADRREFNEYINAIWWGAENVTPIEYRSSHKDRSWKLITSTAQLIEHPRFGPAVILTSGESIPPQLGFDDLIKHDVLRSAVFNDKDAGLGLFSASGHFLQGNRTLLTMLDYTQSELHGMSISEFAYPSVPIVDKKALAEVLEGKIGQHSFKNGYLTSGGDRVWGEVTIAGITGGRDGCDFFVGIFADPSNVMPEMNVGLQAPVGSPVGTHDLRSNILDFGHWKVDKGLICEN